MITGYRCIISKTNTTNTCTMMSLDALLEAGDLPPTPCRNPSPVSRCLRNTLVIRASHNRPFCRHHCSNMHTSHTARRCESDAVGRRRYCGRSLLVAWPHSSRRGMMPMPHCCANSRAVTTPGRIHVPAFLLSKLDQPFILSTP